MPGFHWWLSKVATLGAVDLNEPQEQERYALTKWPADALQNALQRFNRKGGLPEMLFSMQLINQQDEWLKTEAAMRQVMAHNCFLHRGGSVFVRNSSLFRNCLTSVSYEFKHLLLGMGFDDKQEIAENFYLFNPVSVLDAAGNSSVQHVFNPILVCSGSDYLTGCSEAGELMGYYSPVWGNGVQNDDPPPDLLNCTPGQFKLRLVSCWEEESLL